MNHFPGGGYITRKGSLAMADLSFIPRSFKIPEKKDALLNYVSTLSIRNPSDKMCVKCNRLNKITFILWPDLLIYLPQGHAHI